MIGCRINARIRWLTLPNDEIIFEISDGLDVEKQGQKVHLVASLRWQYNQFQMMARALWDIRDARGENDSGRRPGAVFSLV
jgi:hypothetical protein